MVSPHERFAREIVQGPGEAFGATPAIDEQQRRPMPAYELEQARVNGVPD